MTKKKMIIMIIRLMHILSLTTWKMATVAATTTMTTITLKSIVGGCVIRGTIPGGSGGAFSPERFLFREIIHLRWK